MTFYTKQIIAGAAVAEVAAGLRLSARSSMATTEESVAIHDTATGFLEVREKNKKNSKQNHKAREKHTMETRLKKEKRLEQEQKERERKARVKAQQKKAAVKDCPVCLNKLTKANTQVDGRCKNEKCAKATPMCKDCARKLDERGITNCIVCRGPRSQGHLPEQPGQPGAPMNRVQRPTTVAIQRSPIWNYWALELRQAHNGHN